MCFTSVLMFCALQIFPFAHLFSQVFFPSVLHTLTLEGALGIRSTPPMNLAPFTKTFDLFKRDRHQ